LVAALPLPIIGVWVLFSYLIEINNTVLRSASIWILLVLLMAAAATVDAIRKQRTQ